MTNNEQMEAYFDGKLNEGEKQDFIQKMNNDSNLKREFNFQSDIVNGLHTARKAELKARLNNISIGGNGVSLASVGKAALVALVIGSSALIYWSSTEKDAKLTTVDPKEIEEKLEDLIPVETATAPEKKITPERVNSIPSEELQTSETTKEEKITIKKAEIHKPKLLEPLELTNENEEKAMPDGFDNEDATKLSNIDVEIDNSKRKYSFHYQFKQSKLFLFGSFDKGLYEIIEIKSIDDKVLYLFYKEKYYQLDKNISDITALSELNDTSLMNKLEKIRER